MQPLEKVAVILLSHLGSVSAEILTTDLDKSISYDKGKGFLEREKAVSQTYLCTALLPPQEAKTRGGIIVSPAYTYKECVNIGVVCL